MTIVKHVIMSTTLGTNAHHHQSGVLPSATPAMASEIQPGERRLLTIGSRTSSAGGALTLMLATVTPAVLGAGALGWTMTASDIIALLSRPHVLRVPHERVLQLQMGF